MRFPWFGFLMFCVGAIKVIHELGFEIAVFLFVFIAGICRMEKWVNS